MRSAARVPVLLTAVVLCSAAGWALTRPAKAGFDHLKHRNLFPACESCHVGAGIPGDYNLWPSAESCAACHDGEVEARIEWSPPAGPSPSNLRFTHGVHQAKIRSQSRPDSSVPCVTCHSEQGAQRMDVRHAVVEQCVRCHQPNRAHLELADSACSTCHVTLAASTFAADRIAAFPVPEDHRQAAFVLEGHGRVIKESGNRSLVPASCATCHARNFCTECHVDALEQRSIQALASDPRSLLHQAELKAPSSHASADFVYRHGDKVGETARECRTCHTQESCTACHVTGVRQVAALPPWVPGRGRGAQVARTRPASHDAQFRDRHGSLATAAPKSCTTCHTRTQCLDCHRPTAASAGVYHPAGFLTRHPAAAYARETSCADCHSPTGFCAACHQQSGLVAQRTLRPGFHDGKQFFIAGHGQAARQSLETCVGCHTERDCLTCHSAQGGRRFNPHGPGFDGARLKRKNPEMCTACHAVSIP